MKHVYLSKIESFLDGKNPNDRVLWNGELKGFLIDLVSVIFKNANYPISVSGYDFVDPFFEGKVAVTINDETRIIDSGFSELDFSGVQIFNNDNNKGLAIVNPLGLTVTIGCA
jgi:hypothetical protein